LHAARTLVVLEVRQPDGPNFVTVVEAGLLAKTGMNAAGLGLSAGFRGAAATAKTLDDFRALLADHADYPNSICAHPDPADHPREQGATIASVLMDLNARHLWLAAGHPCLVPYERLDVVL
jgi:hypothetical protein